MIDEGFGSLDRASRAAMIRDLHALAEVLPRVIVVSHDEDFAAAFPHRYDFRLENGRTAVVPGAL
jgi:DNA repair exonuclease SbcCD ATPase subunit